MGNDGGSVPRRIEIVKVRKVRKEENKAEVTRCKWETCALSKTKLSPPVVACAAGHLYNKEAVLQAVLEGSLPPHLSHIKGLRDLTNATLTPAANAGARESDSVSFVCPVAQIPMKGTYQFSLVKDCGCVVSKRALDEITDRSACVHCGTPLSEGEGSLLCLNGDEATVKALLAKDKAKKRAEKERKKAERKAKKKAKKDSSALGTAGDSSLVKNTAGEREGASVDSSAPLSLKGTKRKAEESAKAVPKKRQRTGPSINSTFAAAMAVNETAEQLMPKFANKDVYSSLFFKADDAANEGGKPQLTTSNAAFCGRFLTHRPA